MHPFAGDWRPISAIREIGREGQIGVLHQSLSLRAPQNGHDQKIPNHFGSGISWRDNRCGWQMRKVEGLAFILRKRKGTT